MMETKGRAHAGVPYLILAIVLYLALIPLFYFGATVSSWLFVLAVAAFLVALVFSIGLYTVQPNQAAVLILFGDYKGTDRTPGLRFANPLYQKRLVSLRVRNFTTQTSKVNDANGNPIMIAAVVVWRVTDTARAVFGVDDYDDYVRIQSESAVRQLARSYPYDAFDDSHVTTLIGDAAEVNDHLRKELQDRVEAAGVEVLEARITDLSYAPEIAEAMLRRQQAAAIVAARAKIVEGAVMMVREAIESLEAGSEADGKVAIPLDRERRAIFATNLMTVIASDQPTTPIVNVGNPV